MTEQLEILEAAFECGQYPPVGVREKLAAATDLTEARVQVIHCFKNLSKFKIWFKFFKGRFFSSKHDQRMAILEKSVSGITTVGTSAFSNNTFFIF